MHTIFLDLKLKKKKKKLYGIIDKGVAYTQGIFVITAFYPKEYNWHDF